MTRKNPAYISHILCNYDTDNKEMEKTKIMKEPTVKNSQETMNIAFTCNDTYIKYVSVTMISILQNNMNENIHFYIICNDISERSKRQIDIIKNRYSFEITYLSVDAEKFLGINKNYSAHVSNETNYRYFVADLIPEIDKLLFLDGDLVVNDSLAELYQTDIKDYLVAVAKDPLDRDTGRWFENFNIPVEYPYLNTGVFLINMEKWRKEHIGEKLLKTAQEWGKLFWFPDQDAINVVCYNRNCLLNQKYNFCCELLWENSDDRKQAEMNAIIYHWAGPRKPWLHPGYRYGDIFWKYARQTPFYEEIIYQNVKSNYIPLNTSIVKDAFNFTKNKIRYWRYKLLSKITLGNMRKHYKSKKKDLKKRLKQVKAFLKGK